MKHIVLAGTAADPPHFGHIQYAHALKVNNHFDLVVWTPSGARPKDKPNMISGLYRRAMAELAFGGLVGNGFELDLSEVEGTTVYTIDRLEQYERKFPRAKISWSTGADVLVPREVYGGLCEVEAKWHRGAELMQKPCIVVPRAGVPRLQDLGLPGWFKKCKVSLPDVSSSDIRGRIATGQPWEHLVPPQVAAYIKEHRLYLPVE